MSRRRFENLEPERQQRLLDSAAEEFAEKGYDAASLNRILDRSGMSKSSLYYYFDNKADLFGTLVERSLALLIREIGGFDPERLTAETFWSELEELMLRSVRAFSRDAWYLKLGRMFYRLRGSRKGGATESTMKAARGWIGRILQRGQALGVIRADLPLSLLIDSSMALGEAMDRWSVEHWDEMTPEERLEITSRQIGLFRRMLAPEGGGAGHQRP
jgi:AcrR family transcriptional regulator